MSYGNSKVAVSYTHLDVYKRQTMLSGTGLYKDQPRNIIYSVVAQDQVKKIVQETRAVDQMCIRDRKPIVFRS